MVNLSTSDFFRPKKYQNANSLLSTIQSENYEIISIEGDFPILFDSIKNEFYIKNKRGLTKINSQGDIILSENLLSEEYTSVYDFANFTPYVFSENIVYDFSGDRLIKSNLDKRLNTNNELTENEFKNTFEKMYQTAEIVIYETDRNIDYNRNCFPIYFKINDKWILLYSKKDDYQFTHSNTQEDYGNIIGQIDYKDFPAKFNHKRLIVLKDIKNGIYSTNLFGEKISDKILNTFFTTILNERKLDYQTNNKSEIISSKKEDYSSARSHWILSDLVFPSFLMTAYFQIDYNDETFFIKGKAIKYYGDQIKNGLYLYEIPKKFRKNIPIAFLHYDPGLGSSKIMSTGITTPNAKGVGLYIIKPKKK